MIEGPLVSVITPCFNHGKFIRDTIESVVNQTYKNIEYFIIDDGSTDDSAKVIEELKEKYSNSLAINFEVQQNKGLANTMNKLISKCKGKYIAPIESDDVWTLDKIEKQVTFFESHEEFAVCGGNALCINEQNEVLHARQQTIKIYTVYNLEDIMSFNFQIYPLTVMVRREIYDLVGKFDESMVTIDIYTWIKIAVNDYPIVILPDIFGYYRLHGNNLHYSTSIMYKTIMKTVDQFKDHPLYPMVRRGAMYYSFPYLAVNAKKKAIQVLPEAFKLKWRIIKGIIALAVPFPILKFFTKVR